MAIQRCPKKRKRHRFGPWEAHCEKFKSIECDIWIPAAQPDVIDEENVHRLKAKLVIEGANIPITPGAEKYLHEKE